MSAPRVLLVHSSSGRYGADRQLELIATHLDPDRYVPVVVLPHPGPLAESLRSAGVEVLIRTLGVIRREHANPRGLAGIARAVARDGIGLRRLIHDRGIALVHSNTSVVLSGAAAAALARIPHVWHVREDYSRFGRIWPAYKSLLLRSASALPCVSRAVADQFGASSKARVLYDGIATSAERAAGAGARMRLGLPQDEPTIVLVGRVSDWKGQDILVRALAEPPLAEIGATGVIAGEPWPGAEDRLRDVEQIAATRGVSDRVRFLGFREDVASVYGAADVVAVPSTAPDPLPGSALEAAAAGCAVIASAHGGLPEIIRDGETGRLVPPGDPAALATVARELLDDEAQRARLGSAAAADIAARFAPGRLLAELQALYDEAVRGP